MSIWTSTNIYIYIYIYIYITCKSFLPTRGKIYKFAISCRSISLTKWHLYSQLQSERILLQICLTTKRKRNMQSLITFGKLVMAILTLLFVLGSCVVHATGKYITLYIVYKYIVYIFFWENFYLQTELSIETLFKPTVILLIVKSTIGPLTLLDRSNLMGSQIDPRLLWESVHTMRSILVPFQSVRIRSRSLTNVNGPYKIISLNLTV